MAYVAPTLRNAGEAILASDQNIWVNNQIDLRSYQNRYARSQYTTSARTINSTSWTDLGGPADLTLGASSGDVIEVALTALVGNQATDIYLDVATIVSGNPVNAFGNATTPSNTHQGILGWAAVGSTYTFIGANYFYTLVAGDISGGNVVLRLRARTAAAVARDVAASTTQPITFFARNHGPVTT